MNKFFYIFCMILSCTLMCCTNNDGMDGVDSGKLVSDPDNNCMPAATDRYVYPVVPGTEAWNAASLEERASKLSQLPDNQLKSLSSFALIQSLLDKPLLWMSYYLSSNSSPIGTCNNYIYASHNSVPAFEERENRVEALIAYYKAVGCDCFEGLDTENKMNFSVQLCVLEVWFTRDALLQSMNSTQKQQVVALLLQKYKQKQASNIGTDGSLATMAWIMYDAKYQPVLSYFNNADLSKDSFFVLGEQLSDILLFAENYTSSK